MTSLPPETTAAPRESWRQFAAAIAKAFAIGLVLFVPIALDAWWTTRPTPPAAARHLLSFVSLHPPADDEALRQWLAGRPAATAVAVKRVGDRIEASWSGPELNPDSVPWPQFAYPEHRDARVITARSQSQIVLGIGYYTSLLGLCANLGYFVLGFGRLRRNGRARALFARPSWRAAGLGVLAGLGLGGAMLLWDRVPMVGGTTAGALGGLMFCPKWVAWTVLALVPIALPLAQESFFRGREDRSLVATSAVFACVHLLPVAFVPAFVAGLVFAWLRRVTGGLWVPVLANGLFLAVGVSLPFAHPFDLA